MPDDSLLVLATLAIFLFAGFIKGIVGLGLPVLAIGLLSLLMPPAQAVALLTVRSRSRICGSSPRGRILRRSRDGYGRCCWQAFSPRLPVWRPGSSLRTKAAMRSRR